MNVHIDDHELAMLEVDLAGAPGRIQWKAPAVLRTRVGPRLAREMAVDASGHRGNWFGRPGTEYITPTPATSSEMVDTWTVEAGIEKRGSGRLFNILVYGSVNNAPVYDHTMALRRTAPFAEQWLADAAEESVLGDGES